MRKRRNKCPVLCYGIFFAIGIILAFILPVGFVAVLEAIIILVFGWMLLFG